MNKNGTTHIKGTYAEIIKQVRAKLLLTQEGLADEIGVCPATLVRWEKGQSVPSFLRKEMLERMCEKHGITIEEEKERNGSKL